MDNFNQPRAVVTLGLVELNILKLWHAVGSLYIWEYLTTLDYEWRVIRGRLPYRWTTLVYSFARLACLVSVIIFFVTMDATSPINCQLWAQFAATLLCLASISASLLIVLRTIAIWNRNRVAVTLTIMVWGTSIGFHLHDIILVHSTWHPQHGCGPTKNDFDVNPLGTIVTMVAEIVMLLIILAGLLDMRRNGAGAFGLTRLLWKQGIIWLLLGSAVQVPQLVITLMHINDELRGMSVVPSQIVLIIAATRMHRFLVNFAAGSSNVIIESPQVSNLASAKTKRSSSPSTVPDRVEIAIHSEFERHPTSSTKDDDSITISSTVEKGSEIIGHSPKYSLGTKDTYAA